MVIIVHSNCTLLDIRLWNSNQKILVQTINVANCKDSFTWIDRFDWTPIKISINFDLFIIVIQTFDQVELMLLFHLGTIFKILCFNSILTKKHELWKTVFVTNISTDGPIHFFLKIVIFEEATWRFFDISHCQLETLFEMAWMWK